ncbi:MOSC domain-containing protein [Limnoglobus roseus]|uniref:MOSC domain-containing protein n=1 Tax=Limnoglobus roseus TaxID=2598579 RepID=A0A5C1AKD8_9BACT|nr:MOSC domain-containing protein [Limnoglobus roseus]QEL19125.1 MOSC domain-containing protein [Limnoglobus roseus]
MSAILESIQVGLPRFHGQPGAVDPMDRPWATAFFKERVDGPVEVGWETLAGDGVSDLENHGGPDKAILAYSADHYPNWQDQLNLPALPFGAFGENFTIRGLSESTVCIGDQWRIGPCRFEVSQPRQPCWKLARRWRIKELPALVVSSGRSGWYLRILQAGTLTAGMNPSLEHRPNPDWSVQRANRVFYQLKNDAEANRELLSVSELSISWKELLRSRVA